MNFGVIGAKNWRRLKRAGKSTKRSKRQRWRLFAVVPQGRGGYQRPILTTLSLERGLQQARGKGAKVVEYVPVSEAIPGRCRDCKYWDGAFCEVMDPEWSLPANGSGFCCNFKRRKVEKNGA